MSVETVGLLGLLLMFILMFLKIPIAISLAVPGILGALYIRGLTPVETSVETIIWAHSFSYTFSTIPMFVLMGELLYTSGISSELFNAFKVWMNRLKGGLGVATVGASALFAAASGSSLASTGTMGVLSYKEMKKAGYEDKFSTGTIVAGGTLGILIPPSTAFIIYGVLTEASIGKLLIAGIIPGIILTILYILTVMVSVHLNPGLAPKDANKYTIREKLASLKSTIWIFILFIIVIGGMYAGWFSPTEAAGIGAASALILSIFKRKMNIKVLMETLERTLKTTSFIFAIILGAFILNYFLALTGLPEVLAGAVSNSAIPSWAIILLILLMYIFLGCVMDTLAMIVITMPIILPTVLAMGYDIIWFGVWTTVIIELALITPPVGMNCFVLKGAVPNIKLEDIFKGALRFVIPILVLLLLLLLFPEIALWLPENM